VTASRQTTRLTLEFHPRASLPVPPLPEAQGCRGLILQNQHHFGTNISGVWGQSPQRFRGSVSALADLRHAAASLTGTMDTKCAHRFRRGANKVAFYQNHPALAEFGSGNLWSQGNQTLGEGIANEVQVLERREWLAANARKLLGMASGATFTAVNTNPKVEIHHVIPYSDPAAQRARNVLTTWLLSIHDPANAAILPSTCHRGPYAHGQPGKAYGNRIVAEFDVANVRARNVATASANIEPGRQVILETLRAIGDQISMNCGDARTVPMQAALRAVERPLPRPHIAHYLDAARVP